MIEYKNAAKLTGDTLIKSLLEKVSPPDRNRIAIRMKVASVIGACLTERGLSKVLFAKRINKEPSMITKWLSGTHNFTIDTLSDISTCLGIPISDFFAEQEEPVVLSMKFAVSSPPSSYPQDYNLFRANYNEAHTCAEWIADEPLVPGFGYKQLKFKIDDDHFATSSYKIKGRGINSLIKI